MLKILRQQKGAAAAVLALMITSLAGMGALVVDMGLMYINRAQLATMADAAALAGARELVPQLGTGDPVASAKQYAALNGQQAGDVVNVTVDKGVVSVVISRKVNLFFAPLLKIYNGNVSATSRATAGVLASATGVVPWAVVRQDFVFGTPYTLKAGGGDGTTGNFGALALGGRGANVYELNIEQGYGGTLRIGQQVTTQPGNMSGPTTEGVSYRINADPGVCFPPDNPASPRIITIPVVDTLEVNGRSQITIVGFANFFLESVGGSGNQNYVTGRFISVPRNGEVSQSERYFGSYNVKLVE